jgi:hypothetical protein
MANTPERVMPCEGCPLAGDLKTVNNFVAYIPEEHDNYMFIALTGEPEGARSKTIKVLNTHGFDMQAGDGRGVFNAVRERVANCDAPSKYKALGGLVTRKACGAFPGENPRKLKSNGSMHDWDQWVGFDFS